MKEKKQNLKEKKQNLILFIILVVVGSFLLFCGIYNLTGIYIKEGQKNSAQEKKIQELENRVLKLVEKRNTIEEGDLVILDCCLLCKETNSEYKILIKCRSCKSYFCKNCVGDSGICPNCRKEMN